MKTSPSILPQPTTARVLQVSSKETLIYDMPMETYALFKDVCDWWPFEHGRRDKLTVEKVLAALERGLSPLGIDVRKGVAMKREETNREIRGLKGDVWYDEFRFYEEGAE